MKDPKVLRYAYLGNAQLLYLLRQVTGMIFSWRPVSLQTALYFERRSIQCRYVSAHYFSFCWPPHSMFGVVDARPCNKKSSKIASTIAQRADSACSRGCAPSCGTRSTPPDAESPRMIESSSSMAEPTCRQYTGAWQCTIHRILVHACAC